MNPWLALVITIGLIGLSAFFVIIEFALLAARRHRLEEAAATSRSARAALRGSNELTIMLAGAQLGITACTFALGAITEPAVHHLLAPVFEAWGLPYWISDVLAFAIALLLVTFLHLVVGEMAPKSWAIAHPERAAVLIGIPACGFVWVFRPLLVWVNRVANRLVAASGVTPVDRAGAGGHDVETISHLVEHSAEVGALESSFHTPLAGVIELQTRTLGEVVRTDRTPTSVSHDATVGDVHAAARRDGHLRILVRDADERIVRIVHVRDVLREPAERPIAEFTRPVLSLPAQTLMHEALTRMRRESEQLAIVRDGERVSVVTIADLLRGVLPRPAFAPSSSS